MLGIIKNPRPVTAENEKTNPSESFGQTSEVRGVVAARSGSNAGWRDHTHLARKEFGPNCQATRQQFPSQPNLCRQLGAYNLRR